MRANRKMRNQTHDEAQVGIGTMIVFIATVLVAAIAAGVLIDTSGKLSERSSRTGQEATDQVSSNLAVQSVIGHRDTNTVELLDDMYIFISLAPGATSVDLNQVRIQLQNGSSLRTFSYESDGGAESDEFVAAEIRDADSSWSTTAPVMTAGDMVNLTIPLDTNSMRYPARDPIKVFLIPEVGSKVEVGFTTPPSFGTQYFVELK